MEQREKVRILVVDDNPDTLLALEMILEDLQEEVITARSGLDALRKLLKDDFAVILLDVNMPGMDGFETAELIRKRKSSERTPIIFITAFSDAMYVERGYSLGAVDYILAPVVPEILRTKVGVFADLYRKTRQLTRQADSLQERATQLHLLTEASLAITSAPSLEAIIHVLEEWARKLISANRASAIISDVSTTHPSPLAEQEPERRVTVNPTPSVGQESDRRMIVGKDQIIVPLVGGAGHVMGRLYVSDKPRGEMTEDDEALLIQLAQIASIAMENVIAARELAAEINERRRALDDLKRSHEQLRDLTARVESVREEDRTRISREIHDELGQALTGLKLDIALVKEQSPGADAALLKKLDAMSDLVDTAMHTVRNIATELRPVVLDQFGLLPAIEWLAQECQSRTGMTFKLNFYVRQLHLPQERSTAVFRIVQEILTNITRHANASSVTIMAQECGGKAIVEVIDNGHGITDSEISDVKSLGLLSMRERAALLGGSTAIVGRSGQGTTVTVTIPLVDGEEETSEASSSRIPAIVRTRVAGTEVTHDTNPHC